MMLKENLFKQCELFVNEKSAIIDGIMRSNQIALEQESKSSAGDKHETGRAMLHLEMEKAAQQFEAVKQMRDVLKRIQVNAVSERIKLGSLVTTDGGIYFLSISAGPLIAEGKSYYAVSVSSPIGACLLGMKQGSEITFGEKTIRIQAVE